MSNYDSALELSNHSGPGHAAIAQSILAVVDVLMRMDARKPSEGSLLNDENKSSRIDSRGRLVVWNGTSWHQAGTTQFFDRLAHYTFTTKTEIIGWGPL